jgi:hypothetical protein
MSLWRGVDFSAMTSEEAARRYRCQIESGIPCPPKAARGGSCNRTAPLYPFPAMCVDQSFFVPASDSEGVDAFWLRIANSINSYHQAHAARFTWRTRTAEQEPEYREAGWRVWRLK